MLYPEPAPERTEQQEARMFLGMGPTELIIILVIVVAIVETLIGRESLAFHTIASTIGRTVTNPFQLEII